MISYQDIINKVGLAAREMDVKGFSDKLVIYPFTHKTQRDIEKVAALAEVDEAKELEFVYKALHGNDKTATAEDLEILGDALTFQQVQEIIKAAAGFSDITEAGKP
jgi:hypothetical protein